MDEMTKKPVNPLVAGLTGAVIGAGMGAVATKVLTDKKMRDKILKTAAESMDKLDTYAHRIRMGTKVKS